MRITIHLNNSEYYGKYNFGKYFCLGLSQLLMMYTYCISAIGLWNLQMYMHNLTVMQTRVSLTHTFRRTDRLTHVHRHTHTDTHVHTCTHTRTHTCTHTNTRTHTHVHTHMYTHTHTHTYTHTHTHTHTHTNIHTQSL